MKARDVIDTFLAWDERRVAFADTGVQVASPRRQTRCLFVSEDVRAVQDGGMRQRLHRRYRDERREVEIGDVDLATAASR